MAFYHDDSPQDQYIIYIAILSPSLVDTHRTHQQQHSQLEASGGQLPPRFLDLLKRIDWRAESERCVGQLYLLQLGVRISAIGKHAQVVAHISQEHGAHDDGQPEGKLVAREGLVK